MTKKTHLFATKKFPTLLVAYHGFCFSLFSHSILTETTLLATMSVSNLVRSENQFVSAWNYPEMFEQHFWANYNARGQDQYKIQSLQAM